MESQSLRNWAWSWPVHCVESIWLVSWAVSVLSASEFCCIELASAWTCSMSIPRTVMTVLLRFVRGARPGGWWLLQFAVQHGGPDGGVGIGVEGQRDGAEQPVLGPLSGLVQAGPGQGGGAG